MDTHFSLRKFRRKKSKNSKQLIHKHDTSVQSESIFLEMSTVFLTFTRFGFRHLRKFKYIIIVKFLWVINLRNLNYFMQILLQPQIWFFE